MAPVHPGSPPPRKRLMLASQAQVTAQDDAMSGIRQQSALELLEQPPSQLSRARRHHSDPGACILKMQRSSNTAAGFMAAPAQHSSVAVVVPTPAADGGQQPAHGSAKSSSKRERTSNEGPTGASNTSSGSSPGPSFTITVDCRGENAATALWYRMHQLEIRNKELEQQLVERMQAASISSITAASSSGQQQLSSLQKAAERPTSHVSSRAHAELSESETAVAMDVDASCSPAAARSQQALASTSLKELQPQQMMQQGPVLQQQQQQPPQQVQEDAASAQELVFSLRQQVQTLQRDLLRQKQLNNMLQSDNADLEAVLKETERQRREFAARYAFMTLDTDGDGYVSVEQVLTYDLFSCYAPCVLITAFNVWRWDSGFPGYLCMDDFVRFVEYAEDRSTRDSQRFWFSVMDADGDGRLSWADMKLLYDAVERSCGGGMLLHFEDLMNQIRDMVVRQHDPAGGFTAKELWDSKLGAGVIGLLTNANNMLLQRSTAEWGRGDFPL